MSYTLVCIDAEGKGEYTPGICFELKSGLIVLQMRTPTLEFRCWCYPFFRKYIRVYKYTFGHGNNVRLRVCGIEQGDSSGSKILILMNFPSVVSSFQIRNVTTVKTGLSSSRLIKVNSNRSNVLCTMYQSLDIDLSKCFSGCKFSSKQPTYPRSRSNFPSR